MKEVGTGGGRARERQGRDTEAGRQGGREGRVEREGGGRERGVQREREGGREGERERERERERENISSYACFHACKKQAQLVCSVFPSFITILIRVSSEVMLLTIISISIGRTRLVEYVDNLVCSVCKQLKRFTLEVKNKRRKNKIETGEKGRGKDDKCKKQEMRERDRMGKQGGGGGGGGERERERERGRCRCRHTKGREIEVPAGHRQAMRCKGNNSCIAFSCLLAASAVIPLSSLYVKNSASYSHVNNVANPDNRMFCSTTQSRANTHINTHTQ